MALNPNKEVFMFVVEFEHEEVVADDEVDDIDSESQESGNSEGDE